MDKFVHNPEILCKTRFAWIGPVANLLSKLKYVNVYLSAISVTFRVWEMCENLLNYEIQQRNLIFGFRTWITPYVPILIYLL